MTRRRIGLSDLIARGPVLGRSAIRRLQRVEASGVEVSGTPSLPFPLSPVGVFGVTYDLDLVIVDDHPSWDMHELARVQTPDGPLWLCKDSRAGSLEQVIVSDHPQVEHLLPEVPLKRLRHPVEVEDRSEGRWLDLSIRYVDPDRMPVSVTYRGRAPKGPVGKRNSSTMGHSRDAVLAALDVSHRAFAKHVEVTIGDRVSTMERILGVVPFQVALVQTQAGFGTGSWRWRADGQEVLSTHASGATQRWFLEHLPGGVALVQAGRLRTLRHVFRRNGAALELHRVDVVPWDATAPAATAWFHPCLPDLRHDLDAPWEGQWMLDVNGQRAHATGRVVVRPNGPGRHRLDLQGTAPRWTLDRPLALDVHVDGATASIDARVERS